MRPHLVPLFACLLVVAPSAAFAEVFASEQCFNLPSHAEARACLEVRERASAGTLGRAEEAFLLALSNWDQEPNFKARARSNFKASAASFSRYRSAQCELQASLAAGGNAAGDRRLLCAIELNEQRATQLQSEAGTLK